MTLRTQLLALFAALAVVPLLAIGVVDYVRSVHALEDLIASQTALVAGQAAGQVADRYSKVEAHLALMSENTSTLALLERPDGRGEPSGAGSDYLVQLWRMVRPDFARMTYRDSAGNVVAAFGDDTARADRAIERLYQVSRPIRADGGRIMGYLEAEVRIDSLLSGVALDTRFGRSGRSALIETAGGEVLREGGGTGAIPGGALLRHEATTGTGEDRRIAFTADDSPHIATVSPAAGSPFAIVSAGSVDELSAPFGRIRNGNLALVLVMTAIVATLFLILLWRATHSLSQLTRAADLVGQGNLAPPLPAARGDEVGRLTAAFETMTGRVRDSLEAMERSRQLAAVGAFASQIAHEIRNPLTSIKLNLQTLERAARDGGVRADLADPVAISLREIQRLDRTVRGVLQLGRDPVSPPAAFRLHDAVLSALASMRPAVEQQGITVALHEAPRGHRVDGDRALVEAALINLLVNATEAMPSGGEIRVLSTDASYEGRRVSRVRIEDCGPGIAPALRDRVFAPFYSTRPEGTGLGLALAQRTVEEHRGRLWAEGREDGASGAAFVLELPSAGASP